MDMHMQLGYEQDTEGGRTCLNNHDCSIWSGRAQHVQCVCSAGPRLHVPTVEQNQQSSDATMLHDGIHAYKAFEASNPIYNVAWQSPAVPDLALRTLGQLAATIETRLY